MRCKMLRGGGVEFDVWRMMMYGHSQSQREWLDRVTMVICRSRLGLVGLSLVDSLD